MKTSKEQSTQAAWKAGSQPAALAQPTLAQQLGNAGLLRILQAKLTVSDPQDHFEQEADRVADQVMRMPDVAAESGGPAPASTHTTSVQRAADATSALPVVDTALEEAVAALDRRGQGLSPEVRSFMEPRFGADLSSVRIHTDAHAHDLARSVNARAFAVGRNLVFGAGYYAPQTDSGRRLIAHELTHTLQQGAATRLARTPTSGSGDGDAPGPREPSATQPYPTIKQLGPYTYASQEVSDGGTAHWRVWNWARIGGPSKVADRGPQQFLEQLVAQARDAGNDMLVLTIENIEAPSVQRLSKPDSPMAKHLGAIAVSRINDTTIRWVIPLGGNTNDGGMDASRRPAQPRDRVVVGGLGREPGRTSDAPRDRVVVGGPGRQAGRTSDAPRDPVVVGGFGRGASRPVDVPEVLSPSDAVPIPIRGEDTGSGTNPVPRPGEAVPEHIDDGPSIHRPPAQSPHSPAPSDGVPLPISEPGDSSGVRTNPVPRPGQAVPEHVDDGPNVHRPSTPSPDATPQAPDPFGSTPPETPTQVQRGTPTRDTSSQTPNPFASTPQETPTPVQSGTPTPDGTTSPVSPPRGAPTQVQGGAPTLVQPGTPTQVDSGKLFKDGRSGAAERLAPAVERVSLDQWVHPIQQVGEGINTKYLLVDAVTGERWLFKPAEGEQVMKYGPELGIRTGERWRRALAAAYLAQDLGLNTPYVRLIEMEGMVGSLQEWRQGYEGRPKISNQAQAEFDRFWNSRFRHDIDAFDYFIANQDRHKGNVMTRTEDDRPSPLLIDQDSGVPASPERFSRKGTRDQLRHWQRDLPPNITSELAGRFLDLAARFPDAELRKWLTDKEVDGLWSRLNEVVDALHSGRIGIIEESPTRAAETARQAPNARRTSGNAASGTFSTGGSTQDADSGTFSTGGTTKSTGSGSFSTSGSTKDDSTGGTTEVASTKTAPTGSPSPTSASSGSAATTVTRTGPASASDAATTQEPTKASSTPPSGEAPLPKAGATIALGPEPWGGPRSNVQVAAADALSIDKTVESQTPQGTRQTSVGASASGHAVTVDVRAGGPARQTTGSMTVTGTEFGGELGRQKQGKGGPTAGVKFDSQGNPTVDFGWALQSKGGSSIKPTISRGTKVNAAEPIKLEDGRFVVAYTMTDTTTAGVGGAARRTPQGRPGFSLGGNISQFEAESQQGTRIFKTKKEAEEFRNNAAELLTRDKTTAAPATSDDATKIAVGETRGKSETEGRNVGVSGSFGGTTLGRNYQTSETTGLSFYRVSEDLLNVTVTVMQDSSKDWGIGALFLANQKGGDTTKGFGVTFQFNISTQAGRDALDLYLKTRIPPRNPNIVSVMDFTSGGSYDRYQIVALGFAAWSDRTWQKVTRGKEGVTKEFGGEQVHQQDPTWLAELTGDRELYSSAQLISQQINGKEQYTAIINIKSESGEYNREQFGKIFMGVKTSGPVNPSGAWTLTAGIDKKVVHELEAVSNKFKDAKNRDDKQRILSEVFRKQGASMAGGLVRSGGGFRLAWDLELKGDPNFPGPPGRDKLVMQREELAGKLKASPATAAQVARETEAILNRLWVRRLSVNDPKKYTDLPDELRKQQVTLIDRHLFEFAQLRSNALMAAGKRDPNESIEAIRARLKKPDAYKGVPAEKREMAHLQDKVADKDAAINELREEIKIGVEAVKRARLLDNIPPKHKKHLLAYLAAKKETDEYLETQAALASKIQELRVQAFNAAPQAQTEAWRQLEAQLSNRHRLLTIGLLKVQDAGAEVRPISKPESRIGDRYADFWAPIEYLPDDD